MAGVTTLAAGPRVPTPTLDEEEQVLLRNLLRKIVGSPVDGPSCGSRA